MANTLKFGAGQWATKEGSTLAYNDENDNYKPLPFDFTRASNATVVNKAGLIETVGNGIPRIDFLGNTQGALKLEPQRTNLITQSEAFPNSYWTKGGASIQGDPSTAGSELIVNGDFATDSDWIKGTGWSISGGSLNGSSTTTSVTQLNTGLVAGKMYQVVYTISNYVSGSVRIELGSANVSVGTTRSANGTYTEYIEALGDEQLIFDGISAFTGSIDNVSVKEVQGFTSPDGTTNAFKLVESSVNEIHSLVRTFSSTSGNSYSFKIYVKYNGRRHFALRESGSTGYYVVFDLLEGTIISSSNATGTIKPMEDGWFEVTHTSVAGVSFNIGYFLLSDSYVSGNVAPYQGDGTSGVYIYGAQLEEGSYATSYIPTQGSAVTRLADSCSQTPPDGVIGQTEGTMFLDFKPQTLDATSRFLSIENSSSVSNGWMGIFSALVSGDIRFRFYGDGWDFNSTLIIEKDTRYKIAVSYKNGVQTSAYVNGNLIGNLTASLSGKSFQKIRLSEATIGVRGDADFNDIKLYNTRLSNSELQALTS